MRILLRTQTTYSLPFKQRLEEKTVSIISGHLDHKSRDGTIHGRQNIFPAFVAQYCEFCLVPRSKDIKDKYK